MKVMYYTDLERELESKDASGLARRLKLKYNYDARARKAKLNPSELKVQDELTTRK